MEHNTGEDQPLASAPKEIMDIFGADIRYRPKNVVCIGYKNVHRFPSERNDVKYSYL